MPRESIGSVVSVGERGSLLVKASPTVQVAHAGNRSPPRPYVHVGTPVLDARRDRIGRVTDVIGPVDSPYFVVQPKRGAKIHRLQGKDLFTP